MPGSYDPEKLKKLLISKKLVSEDDFNAAGEEGVRTQTPIEIVLVEKGKIKDKDLGELISGDCGIPFVDLNEQAVKSDSLELLSEAVARSQQTIIFDQDGEEFFVATPNPNNVEFLDYLSKARSGKMVLYYATPFAMRDALKNYRNNLHKIVEELVEDYEVHHNENSPVMLVDRLLDYAYSNSASDIHLEPSADGTVSVRFRIDGILSEIAKYPASIQQPVVFRIKILSHLRTDERDATQDGRFEHSKENADFDVRVSILPVSHGESVVMRILSEKSRKMELEDLGMLDEEKAKVRRAIDKPYGMIVVVGPTGAGKTTTLYSMVQILNQLPINIVTIEDPVEYSIAKVQQIQVNLKKNITFANGLRSIVRQDPDVIMVGEIRDNETAGIAINAAMTGHLLLSTMHANDAATVFPRILEMGVEPFLIASSVNVVISQRLVRKVCPYCKILYPTHPEKLPEVQRLQKDPLYTKLLEKHFPKLKPEDMKLYRGSGCNKCNHTGYLGRTGIFEVMEMDDDIRDLVISRSSSSTIEAKAIEHGMVPVYYDGVMKVLQGVTTFEEISGLTNQ